MSADANQPTDTLEKDLKATLTPEELDAINAEESPEEQLVMRQHKAATAEDDDDDDADDNAPPIEGKPTADDAAAAAAEAPAKESPPAADDKPAQSAEFTPRYKAELPEDFEERTKAIAMRRAELAKQFKEGEIDFDQYNAGLDEVNAERDALNTARVKAEIASDMNAQTAEQRWQHSIDTFISQVARDEKIDYRADQAKFSTLDMFVKALGADPANADKPYEWFLSEAHAMTKIRYGVAAAPAADKTPPAPTKRKPDLSAVPPSIAHVPGGDGPGDVGGSEFADLDNLEGLALEEALARMTKEQRDRYSRAA